MTSSVEILLSTYNGARYLGDFLESLINQIGKDWRLTVRDDGSRDDTLQVLEAWRPKLNGRLRVLDEGYSKNIGAVGSFSVLLENSTATYVMFADQDDVWLPLKISVTREAMARAEAAYGADEPVLVHTDLTVVDENLRVVQPSLWRSQGVSGAKITFAQTLVENTAWGCTQMLNRALIAKVGRIPPAAVYHDWWITLTAAAFGHIEPLGLQTILYRRHNENESEITNLKAVLIRSLRAPRRAKQRLRDLLAQSRPRAEMFLARHREELSASQRGAVSSFICLGEAGAVDRRLALLTHGLRFSSPLRNAGMLALI